MKKVITFMLALIVFTAALTASLQAAQRTFTVNDRVKVWWRGKWEVCTVLEVKPGKYMVHFEENEAIFDRWVKAKIVKNYTYKNGDIILVKRKGKWLPGRVMASGSHRYKIHYIKHESYKDEWVGPDRIKDIYFEVGEIVKVLWLDDWVEAKILKYSEGKYYVHFIGFSDTNNRWAPVDEIKKRWQK